MNDESMKKCVLELELLDFLFLIFVEKQKYKQKITHLEGRRIVPFEFRL